MGRESEADVMLAVRRNRTTEEPNTGAELSSGDGRVNRDVAVGTLGKRSREICQ
jgi:hypothetical protein